MVRRCANLTSSCLRPFLGVVLLALPPSFLPAQEQPAAMTQGGEAGEPAPAQPLPVVDLPQVASSPESRPDSASSDAVPLSQPDRDSPLSNHRWMLAAASDAVSTGFPRIARSLIEQVQGSTSAPLQGPVLRDYLAALIALGDHEGVLSVTASRPLKESWEKLYVAIAALQVGDTARVTELLTQIDSTALADTELAWLDFARGDLARRAGNQALSNQHFSAALQRAPEILKPDFELLLLRNQLQRGLSEEAIVVELRQKVRDFQGARAGLEAARLLAIALQQLGRTDEALSVLEEQVLLTAAADAGIRNDFLLLVALMSGPESGRGRIALQQILQAPGASRRLQEQALSLLSSSLANEDARRAFRQMIDSLLAAGPRHPLTDELLLLRAELRLQEGNDEGAGEDATRLLELFPGSSLRLPAIRMLAHLAWRKKPPQYRTAASYLAQLRAAIPESPERARLGVLMADCFFLNGDYDSAAGAYADVLKEPVNDPGRVLYQQILSLLRAGDLQEAVQVLDSAQPGLIGPESRWRAEWNVINFMRAQGEIYAAFARLARLLEAGVAEEPPLSLLLRLKWLEAQLSIEVGQPEETPLRCDAILQALEETTAAELSLTQRESIAGHTLLLKSRSLFLLENPDEGLETLQTLRALYPQSEAAQQSYLVQARHYAAGDRLVEAQRMFIALADRYPSSVQAPVALMEAAVAAEQRGIESTFREALSILDRLIAEYPEHPLVFAARLRQGDILRRLNDFATAQLIYEELANRYPGHPQQPLAWMSRADCLAAQAAQDPARRSDAIAMYERLVERNDIPADLRAEAGFKWAYHLERSGDRLRAREAFWLILTRFTNAGEGGILGAKGRYWVARTAIELGQLLESEAAIEQARVVYNLALRNGLPGEALLRSRLQRLIQPR